MKKLLAILIIFFAFAKMQTIAQSETSTEGQITETQPQQSPEEQMAFANEAFEAGQPEVAIMAYEQLLEQGNRSVALFYNLGNAYFESDQLAKAIINYERALLIDNDEEDVLYNIAIAREKAEDEIQPLPPFFLVSWWRLIRDSLSSGMWAFIAILSFWTAVGGLIAWMLSPSRSHKKLGFVAGVFFLGLTLIPVIMGAQRVQTEQHSDFAIVLSPEIPLNVAPTDDSMELLKLHEGTKVEILDSIGAKPCSNDSDCWYKVRLANGEIGWLPIGEIEPI